MLDLSGRAADLNPVDRPQDRPGDAALIMQHPACTLSAQFGQCNFWATVCKTVRPMLSVRRPVLSVCNVRALWPNG